MAAGRGGWFTLQSLDGTLYLGTEPGKLDDGARVVVGPPREARAAATQQWRVVPTDGGFGKLVHRASGRTAHTLNKAKEAGAAVVIWRDEKDAPHAEWRVQ